jgi:hypothetical protein
MGALDVSFALSLLSKETTVENRMEESLEGICNFFTVRAEELVERERNWRLKHLTLTQIR